MSLNNISNSGPDSSCYIPGYYLGPYNVFSDFITWYDWALSMNIGGIMYIAPRIIPFRCAELWSVLCTHRSFSMALVITNFSKLKVYYRSQLLAQIICSHFFAECRSQFVWHRPPTSVSLLVCNRSVRRHLRRCSVDNMPRLRRSQRL